MNPRTELYKLQEIDVAWYRVRRRLLAIQKALQESEALVEARRNLAEAEAAFHEWQASQQDAELEARSLAAKIQNSEQELMSGRVRNPKELSSLQASVEAMQRQQVALEERGVEALLMVEQLNEQLNKQRAALQEMEQEWQGDQASLVEESQKRKRELAFLKQQRAKLVQSLDSALLDQYDYLRKRKNGIAVARLRGDTCDACHMQVPTGVISSVTSESDQLILCPSCGRILYAG